MKILTALILGILALAGCSSDSRDMEMADGARVTTDPVSYAAVTTDSPWKSEWNGKWYYFESQENLQKFQAKPTKYDPSERKPKRQLLKLYPHDMIY